MINLTKKQLLLIIGIGVIIISVIGYYIYGLTKEESYEQFDVTSEETTNKTSPIVENADEEIVIHIAGEVKNPGIVRTKEGARIADIIEKAGGLTEFANITNINLAYIIEDGQKITIPSNKSKEIAKEQEQTKLETEKIEDNIEETNNEYITTENGQGIINKENSRNKPRRKKSANKYK